MSNIAITNYCNLQCPYCFANEFIEENKQEISFEELDRILEFFGRDTSVGRIGLIGGEPTTHSEFREILDRVKIFSRQNRNLPIIIFTNGICLNRAIDDIGPKLTALININEPHIVGEKNWNRIISNLEHLKAMNKLDYVTFGINLYPDIQDYEYILKLAKRYYKNDIRCSFVAPTCNYVNVDKNAYYEEAKKIFLPFLDLAIQYGVILKLDCNHIPNCYYTDEELAKVSKYTKRGNDICSPVVDITPDFRATACFGSYDPVEVSQFNNLEELKTYLKCEKMEPLQAKNDGGNCAKCEKFKNKECQGGCLAFAKYGAME